MAAQRSWHVDWRGAMRQESATVANRCVHLSSVPPRVAFCVAGAARSFATRLAQETLRSFVIDPLAPQGADGGSRIFLQLKTLDSDKLANVGDFHVRFHKHIGPLSSLDTPPLPTQFDR